MSMMSLSVANSVATRSAGNIFNDNLLARRSNLQKDRLVKIREVFRQIDHDESGSLDVDEMRAALGTMGIGKSREQVKELITEIDHDGNGRVDEEEFIDLVLNLEKKKKVEDVLQSNSASYTIMWKNKGNVYTAVGHYTAEARRRALRRVRGDDKSFASESAKLSIPVNALSPIAKAVKTGEEVVINAGAGGFLEKMHSPERRSLAKEFGIRHVHFVPVNGGVMEYGRPAGEEVECIKLLNLLVVDILHPSSPKALFKSVLEILAVLLLIVKLERNDVLMGLSKAVIAFYDALMSFEKSLERDVLSAWATTRSQGGKLDLRRDSASRGRAQAVMFVIGPIFALMRGVVHVMRFLHALWARRRAPQAMLEEGTRIASMRLGTMGKRVGTAGARLASMASAGQATPGSARAGGQRPKGSVVKTGNGAKGNNDVEIFLKST